MKLEIGSTYELQNGEYVTFVREVGDPHYRTIQDDNGSNWYNRENNCGGDNGRVTGTPHDYSYPRNIKKINGEFVKVI